MRESHHINLLYIYNCYVTIVSNFNVTNKDKKMMRRKQVRKERKEGMREKGRRQVD